ncbi:MAG: 6-bladed beta-propeller [Tannerella sp.]|jgi:hypothetical protein|nr:6-bladed beta-propeller [Tannerella sp.]
MKETNVLAVIDIKQQLGKYQAIPASELVSELKYIPLETCSDCLVGEQLIDIFVTSTHIFIEGSSYCYAFGRDGKFIGKIGRIGHGPGEYNNLIGMTVDENKKFLYLETYLNLLEYSWDGKFHRSIPLPPKADGTLKTVTFVRDGSFIGHIQNNTGKEKYNFLLFNDSGQVIKSYDNHVFLDRPRQRYMPTDWAMRPFRMEDRIYVKEIWNDTMYYLNEQNNLIPEFVFNLDKYAFRKEMREDATDQGYMKTDGIILIPYEWLPMVGIPDHIFFSMNVFDASTFDISFPEKPQREISIPAGVQSVRAVDGRRPLGLYDVVNQQTQLLDTDPISRLSGLINDLDGGLSFWPRHYTSDNELVDIWQAYDMKGFLTDEYFNAHQIKDPAAHQRLKAIVKELKDDDNPVIVIGKLK